jgi:hypothetical protein
MVSHGHPSHQDLLFLQEHVMELRGMDLIGLHLVLEAMLLHGLHSHIRPMVLHGMDLEILFSFLDTLGKRLRGMALYGLLEVMDQTIWDILLMVLTGRYLVHHLPQNVRVLHLVVHFLILD